MSRNKRSNAEEHKLELREEELVAQRKLEEVGKVRIRKVVEDVPGRLELDATSEDVEIEHVPIGQAVSERREPWEEDGVLVVPVYEEQLVVTKRLVLREHLRVRRVGTTRRELFEDTLRRERAVVEDLNETGRVHERYPTDADSERESETDGGVIDNIVRKALK
jgi:uncharacterized protein (TIGR02271 family)